MSKLIEAAKEAVKVAECDHDLVRQPDLTRKSTLARFYCRKCNATIYKPIPAWRRQ